MNIWCKIYAAAFLIVSGVELVASRALDSRGVFMIGISLVVALGKMLMPELVRNVPDVLHSVVGSGFVMAGICAVLPTRYALERATATHSYRGISAIDHAHPV